MWACLWSPPQWPLTKPIKWIIIRSARSGSGEPRDETGAAGDVPAGCKGVRLVQAVETDLAGEGLGDVGQEGGVLGETVVGGGELVL
jgi:hypothetical protein